MRIKYNLNRSLKAYLSLAFILTFSSAVFGQITGGEVKPQKDKKEKKEHVRPPKPAFNRDSLSGSTFYLSGLVQHSYRHFEDQSVYNVHAKLNDQTPMITGGTTVGLLMPLAGNLSLDAGVTFFGHGEAYDFEDTESDSAFSYTNVYMQAGIPLKLRYTYGEDLQVFGFAGITPLNILSIRQKSKQTTMDGVSSDLGLEVIRDGFTTFNVMATAGFGVNYYVRHMGFFIGGEYRRHLGNTYSEDTFKRVHNMYGFGLNFGIQYRI